MTWDDWRNVYNNYDNYKDKQRGKNIIKWNDKIFIHNWLVKNNLPHTQWIYGSNKSAIYIRYNSQSK